jgi:hypothetical protein
MDIRRNNTVNAGSGNSHASKRYTLEAVPPLFRPSLGARDEDSMLVKGKK